MLQPNAGAVGKSNISAERFAFGQPEHKADRVAVGVPDDTNPLADVRPWRRRGERQPGILFRGVPVQRQGGRLRRRRGVRGRNRLRRKCGGDLRHAVHLRRLSRAFGGADRKPKHAPDHRSKHIAVTESFAEPKLRAQHEAVDLAQRVAVSVTYRRRLVRAAP